MISKIIAFYVVKATVWLNSGLFFRYFCLTPKYLKCKRMKRNAKMIVCLLVVLLCEPQLLSAFEKLTMDEAISYLESETLKATGIKNDFAGQILGKQRIGTREKKYKLKILNKKFLMIETSISTSTGSIEDIQLLAASGKNCTNVIRLKDLNPRISLIYKLVTTPGEELLESIIPPHIKIKISAKSTKKWKGYDYGINQVAMLINQSKREQMTANFETDKFFLLTTDETVAEEIARVLSYLILMSER